MPLPREKASLVQYLRLGDVSGCLAHYFPRSIHASTILRLLETSLTAPYLLTRPLLLQKILQGIEPKGRDALLLDTRSEDLLFLLCTLSLSCLPSFLPLVFLFQVTLSSISIAVSIGQGRPTETGLHKG